jgi:hypothetical protein
MSKFLLVVHKTKAILLMLTTVMFLSRKSTEWLALMKTSLKNLFYCSSSFEIKFES